MTKSVIEGSNKPATKVERFCHRDERDSFIKKFGQQEFEEVCKIDENMSRLQDKPIPACFRWLFEHFLTIFYSCEIDINGNRIFRPVDIKDYCETFGIEMSYKERHLLLEMKSWAGETIVELEENGGKENG
ncbi:MAG: hypothetical protein J6S85_19635 [Methanobrevibacter sp.]|nr:hypothetical protein [Methanobrevibacter sp.]